MASSSFDSKFLKDLASDFTTEEQKIFVDNFYHYLEHGNANNVYPIDLDDIWKWLGFNSKYNAKRHLVKLFKEMVDYTISNLLLRDAEQTRGGHNKEKIMLNVNAFKCMCMTVNTEKVSKQGCITPRWRKCSSNISKNNNPKICVNFKTY